jgi:hypothetical protein
MPDPLRRTPLVQEQLALGLNHSGVGEEAERVLTQLIDARGPSSETSGLLGCVYKDRWDASVKKGEKILARRLLGKAIEAYLNGFQTDWSDALLRSSRLPWIACADFGIGVWGSNRKPE